MHAFRFLNKSYSISQLGHVLDCIYCKLKKIAQAGGSGTCINVSGSNTSSEYYEVPLGSHMFRVTATIQAIDDPDGFGAGGEFTGYIQNTGAALVDSANARDDQGSAIAAGLIGGTLVLFNSTNGNTSDLTLVPDVVGGKQVLRAAIANVDSGNTATDLVNARICFYPQSSQNATSTGSGS